MKLTFWRQWALHKKLHIFEWALSAILYFSLGELFTFFRHGEIVFSLAAFIGFMTMIYFVAQEQEIHSKIIAIQNGRRSVWNQKVKYHHENYGRYTTIQIYQAKLFEMTRYAYVIKLFFKNAWWGLNKSFQFIGIVTLVMILMLAYNWIWHPDLVYSAFIYWFYNDNNSIVNVFFDRWFNIGVVMAIIVLFPSTFIPRQSHGEKLLKKAVAEKLKNNHKEKISKKVYQEKLIINLRYFPERVYDWEIKNMSEQDISFINEKAPEFMNKIMTIRGIYK